MARYKILDQHGLNFVTLTVVDWVDVFIRKQYKDLIIESLHYWQKGNHPILLFSPKVIRQKFAYIHANPVVQGWVINSEDYWYSSALYYLEKRGPLKVDILDLGVTEGFFMPKFK